MTSRWTIFFIAAGSSILFCSKGVVAKLAYAEGVDALTVLMLRMGFALPFFVVMFWISDREKAPVSPGNWLRLAGLGFVGYYLSSLLNFSGLHYVSVGLERVILYTYPSMVLAISALWFRQLVTPRAWLACGVAWLGIVAAFAGEMQSPQLGKIETAWGALLIALSAFTYAVFIATCGKLVQTIGPGRFTAIAVGFSCFFIMAHYLIRRNPGTLLEFTPSVYGYGLILALFGTVAPAYLMGLGLAKAGAQRFAIIGTIGPVATLFLAWWLLQETPGWGQIVGLLLTLGGGLAVTLQKRV